MKTQAIITAWIAATLVVANATSIAAETSREFNPVKIGTSGNAYYTIGHTVSADKPAVYYVAIESKKIDINNTVIQDADGQGYAIIKRDFTTTGAKVPWVMMSLERSQIEAAAQTGKRFTVTSGKNTFGFDITGKQFANLLTDADKRDTYALARKHQEKFDASALVPYTTKGSAKVTGQAFLKTRGGDIKVGAGNDVYLVPATLWALGVFDLVEQGYSFSQLPNEQRIQLTRAVRSTQADAGGNFEFTDLPAGEYQLETKITWAAGKNTTGGRVMRKITLSEGQTQKVMLTE